MCTIYDYLKSSQTSPIAIDVITLQTTASHFLMTRPNSGSNDLQINQMNNQLF